MKKLGRLTLLLTAILSFSNLSAQKCEEIDDPITGAKTVRFMNKQQSLKFEHQNGETTMMMTFIYSGEQNVSFPEGSEVFIKLNNDEIIQLKSINSPKPETQVSSSSTSVSVTTRYKFTFKPTPEQIKTLASDKIALIRYPNIDGGTIDIEIKGFGKIYAKKLTEGANCISSHL